MKMLSRRQFLHTLAAVPAVSFLNHYHALAAPERGRVKIRDIKSMVFQGPDLNYTLVRVDTDAGVHGIGEGYGSPGIGIKEGIEELKPEFIGKDPLEIDALITGLGRRTDGSAHQLMRSVAGIEVALWDLAGKILNTPTTTLLGGRFRNRVRVYDHEAPRNMLDKASCREWAQKVKSDPSGFTCHKFSPQHTNAKQDQGRDLANRRLSSQELRQIRQGFENCREAVGWDHDIMVHCHWEYDLRTSIELAEAVEGIKPLWLEDPLPVAYSESWRQLSEAARVPICTGENWMRRAEALPFVVNRGCDIVHVDIRNTAGFLETKRLADLADLYAMPVANHNTGSLVNTWAATQWGATVRDYISCETIIGKRDWMDQVLVSDGWMVKDGFMEMPNKPGLAIELNPDVVKAHLAKGEVWWGT